MEDSLDIIAGIKCGIHYVDYDEICELSKKIDFVKKSALKLLKIIHI